MIINMSSSVAKVIGVHIYICVCVSILVEEREVPYNGSEPKWIVLNNFQN